MDKKVLKTLEYDKIIHQLEQHAVSPLGKQMAKQLIPHSELYVIQDKLNETTDATTLILKHGSLPLGGLKDITSLFKRLSIGGNLSIAEILSISDLLRVTKKIKSYANQCEEDLKNTSIAHLFYNLNLLTSLYKEINRCIISEEEIADDASQNLHQIRRQMKNAHQKIRQQLNSIISSSRNKTMLQDAIITVKNDRFCVPVKSEYKSSFKGIIHEQSSTGSTLFIEPMAVVQLNNQLRDLMIQEEKEIEKILYILSNMAAEHMETLESNQSILAQLDFIFAKGELSIQYQCSLPIFNTEKYINLKKARHPLLDQKTVVPTDIYIGKSFTTLVITGPNTGGKTVTLKTLGLLSLMGQAGLHIPAFDGSSLTVLEDIYADIGDEQSIEQSLSTFSSHMTNIIRILKNATDNSLVLFDELGAGTDPTEGAALAMAILENLFARHILTVATTHYSELKVYALSTDGVENASQEFNVETLRPTYKLLIGIPGKSNAFSISKRLGLNDSIIEEAQNLLAGKEIRFEDLITELEINKKTAIAEKEKAERFRKEAEQLQKEVQIKKEKIAKQKEKILQEAREEAYRILQSSKSEADQIIREMNTIKKQPNQKDLEKKRSKLRNSLSDLEANFDRSKKQQSNVNPKEIKKGDLVYVSTFDQNGTVIQPPNNKGELEVQLGIMKTKVPLNTISFVQEAKQQTNQNKTRTKSKTKLKQQSISSEIDVRGYTSDEAIGLIDKYLDDAYLSHLPQVTIIHGKGTGALRSAIHNYLKRVKYIQSYRLGNFGEGESGVTIVEFQ